MPRFRMGERVRFTAVVKKERGDSRTEFMRSEELPKIYDSWGSAPLEMNEGIIYGYRHVTPGAIDPGYKGGWTMDGYDYGEGPSFAPDPNATRRVWLVSWDLRRKPVMVFDEDIESIDGDRLPPYRHLPPVTMADGSKAWPSDPNWGVRVRSALFPHMYIEQVVEAHSLKGALEEASRIELVHWLQREDDDA